MWALVSFNDWILNHERLQMSHIWREWFLEQRGSVPGHKQNKLRTTTTPMTTNTTILQLTQQPIYIESLEIKCRPAKCHSTPNPSEQTPFHRAASYTKFYNTRGKTVTRQIRKKLKQDSMFCCHPKNNHTRMNSYANTSILYTCTKRSGNIPNWRLLVCKCSE